MKPAWSSFRTACDRLGLKITEDRYARLCRYADLLCAWNRRVNLISRRDTGRILTYHAVDALAAQSYIPRGARACDIGSGAGLPGIPLAIARPDAEILLVESVRKKAGFLTLALEQLRLENAGVIHDRAEDIPPLDCDIVLSRLTGPLRRTLPGLAAHARPGGSILLYKNPTAAPDLTPDSLARLRLRPERTDDITLPLTGIPRRFVLLARA